MHSGGGAAAAGSCTQQEDQRAAERERLVSALDESQRAAVCEDPAAPLLILAGAGSGKTLTMASRIAYILLAGVAPEHILGLCFSRQAAEALRERVAAVLPPALASHVRRLKLKTFHAFGLECLRRHGRIDLATEVYDARRQRELAAAVVETHAAHHKGLEAVLALVEYVNKAKTKKEMRAGTELDPTRQAAYLFRFYQTMLHEQHHAVDFGDLEQMFLAALRPLNQQQQQQQPPSEAEEAGRGGDSNSNSNSVASVAPPPRPPSPVALQLRAQYTHVVVDEFQDLNEVQLECLALLAGDACRVTCVGDPNQCIYTWRGATTNTFERWRSRFPHTKLVRLDTNYRSSAEIVSAVNELTQISQQSFRGHCGRRIVLVRCPHACEQMPLLPRVVEELLRTRDRGLQYGDIAVLCRTRRTVRDAVAALEQDHIPVCEPRLSRPNSIALVRALLSYLRLCVHPHSNLDVECVIRDAPNHFAAPAATKFVFALQAECMQRRRELGAATLQREDSHAAYSYYTILRELVHNGFAHVHERLRTTKPQQKFLRNFIEVTTAAHDSLGRVYCDIEEVVRGVAERAGFDEGGAAGVHIRRRAGGDGGRKRARPPPRWRRSAAVWDDVMGDADDEAAAMAAEGGAMSISQVLVEACRTVQQQALAEQGVGTAAAAAGVKAEAQVRNDTYTLLQRAIDEFLALLPTDDFGPLKGGVKAELTPGAAAVTVTTVHQAKGKEWLAVIVPCCYEGEFPIDARSAEERRVFYVAMSRAKRDLVLMTAERGPPASRAYDGGDAASNGEDQPLQLTPYLRPLLPLMETLPMTCREPTKREP
ncbi:putative ATP-dependent DNA helicase [Trypanosoma conorhini]|uniref:DNA 3'-5' helicase n=1 Tax=Trypanosoma conorhini TaxID=83891 RepID=A0A3R7PIE0_9TRYP|nr:putative ATP-dependent DNA helicase [Trypanosoma conorhini]RNF20353.1 putative ATP-dependent DNA helicase [Trypanosoma conorhini]